MWWQCLTSFSQFSLFIFTLFFFFSVFSSTFPSFYSLSPSFPSTFMSHFTSNSNTGKLVVFLTVASHTRKNKVFVPLESTKDCCWSFFRPHCRKTWNVFLIPWIFNFLQKWELFSLSEKCRQNWSWSWVGLKCTLC